MIIEELVKNRYELPPFATLDRLVRHGRNLVNQQLFSQVTSQLSESEQQRLNDLLDSQTHRQRSCYNDLKKLPKKSSRNHLNDLLVHLTWLETLGNVQDLIKPLTPISGSDPKLDRANERYLLTTFTYGCNLGPTQAARHMRGVVTPQMLSFVNQRHVSLKGLNAALTDIINRYHVLDLPKLWGDGTTAATNKVEAYHGLVKWFFFGGDSVIASNDPEQQEKRIKYNDLIANAVIFQNVVDLTEVLQQLQREGYLLEREDVACLSPYLTSHIKRFGDYLIDMEAIPRALDEQMLLL